MDVGPMFDKAILNELVSKFGEEFFFIMHVNVDSIYWYTLLHQYVIFTHWISFALIKVVCAFIPVDTILTVHDHLLSNLTLYPLHITHCVHIDLSKYKLYGCG